MSNFSDGTRQVKIFKENPSVDSPPRGPILLIAPQDGLDASWREDFIKLLVPDECEWLLSCGPDALLWEYSADRHYINRFGYEIPDDSHFVTASFEEDLDQALFQLLQLGSPADDNKVYENFSIVFTHPDDELEDLVLAYLTNHNFKLITSSEAS